jgi:hypothetical protein
MYLGTVVLVSVQKLLVCSGVQVDVNDLSWGAARLSALCCQPLVCKALVRSCTIQNVCVLLQPCCCVVAPCLSPGAAWSLRFNWLHLTNWLFSLRWMERSNGFTYLNLHNCHI